MIREYTYPAKRTSRPGGNFTVRHFILPVKINGTALWAWLDTGANVSILPKEVAIHEMGLPVGNRADGSYTLAGLIDVPYETRSFTVNLMEYSGGIPELDLTPYEQDANIGITLQAVEFQIPNLTWPEIADRLNPDPPVDIIIENMPWVILGLYGVLDQLNLSFVGKNSVTISSKVQT